MDTLGFASNPSGDPGAALHCRRRRRQKQVDRTHSDEFGCGLQVMMNNCDACRRPSYATRGEWGTQGRCRRTHRGLASYLPLDRRSPFLTALSTTRITDSREDLGTRSEYAVRARER